jgi:hypothetical protein
MEGSTNVNEILISHVFSFYPGSLVSFLPIPSLAAQAAAFVIILTWRSTRKNNHVGIEAVPDLAPCTHDG